MFAQINSITFIFFFLFPEVPSLSLKIVMFVMFDNSLMCLIFLCEALWKYQGVIWHMEINFSEMRNLSTACILYY